MHRNICAALFAAAAATGLATTPAVAATAWQPPTVQECAQAPSGDCNVEVACPEAMPFVVQGAGGMPAAEPPNHAVAMTMNLPISQNAWRIRWRNMSMLGGATVKVAVRVKCSDDAGEAGWPG
ncbi:MAG: hypothetical protein GY791_07940 [Alphaproteobacteria bacterium]|nr:hypothetical protein [Alphaproteobacteria bacterium]